MTDFTRQTDGMARAGADFFEQPVPRRYVHRASVAEVLLTKFTQDAEDSFLIGAQWPRGHSFYRTKDGLQDPMLLAETVRQAGLAIGHLGYDVPLDHSFIMQDLSFHISTEGLASGWRPSDLLLTVSCHDIKRRGKKVVGLEYTASVFSDLGLIGGGSSRFICASPGAYKRLRERVTGSRPGETYLPEHTAAPELVGRDITPDVTLSAAVGDNTWELRCNPAHPILFDHPVDHVPGMVLLEAARQAVHHLHYPEPVTVVQLSADFDQYVELDAPTQVRAFAEAPLADGTLPVHVTLTQHGVRVADARLHAVRNTDVDAAGLTTAHVA